MYDKVCDSKINMLKGLPLKTWQEAQSHCFDLTQSGFIYKTLSDNDSRSTNRWPTMILFFCFLLNADNDSFGLARWHKSHQILVFPLYHIHILFNICRFNKKRKICRYIIYIVDHVRKSNFWKKLYYLINVFGQLMP